MWDAARGCIFHINSVASSPRNQPFQCCRGTTVSPTQGCPTCVPARCLAWKRRPAGPLSWVWHGHSRDSCELSEGPSHGGRHGHCRWARRAAVHPPAPEPRCQLSRQLLAGGPLALQSPPPSWRWAPPGPQVAAGGPRGHPGWEGAASLRTARLPQGPQPPGGPRPRRPPGTGWRVDGLPCQAWHPACSPWAAG